MADATSIYRVQGPDGVIHRFEGPADATPGQVTAAAAAHFAPPPDDNSFSGIRAQLRDRFMEGPAKAGPGIGEGLREVGQSIRNAADYVGLPDHQMVGQKSRAEQSQEAQADIDAYHKQYGDSPWAEGGRVIGNLAATLPLAGPAGEGLAAAGDAISHAVPFMEPVVDFLSGTGGSGYVTKLASRSVNAAEQGAGYTGLTSSGSDEPVSTQMERGAAFGAFIPAVTDVAVAGGRKIAEIASRLVEPFTQAGREKMTGRILNDFASPGGAKMEPAPLPGMDVSAGQASGNRGLISLERILEQRPGAPADAASVAAKSTNDAAVKGAIGQLGNLNSDAGAAVDKQLEAAAKAIKAQTKLAWKAAGVDETTLIPTDVLDEQVKNYTDGLKIVEKDTVEKTGLLDTLDKITASGPQTNLGEVQAWRSKLLAAVRVAYRAGDGDTARVLGGLSDRMSEFLDVDVPKLRQMGGGGPTQAQMDAYNAARAATRQQKQLITEPPAVRKGLAVDSYGADKVPDSKMVDLFLKSPEDLDSYLKVVTKGGNAPAATQALRDGFAQKFLDAVTTNVEGEPASAAKITQFLNNYDHVVNSPVFSDTQRELIQRIKDGANMAMRTARGIPPGGPDTAKKLLGNDYLDVLIGRYASKAIPTAGAAIGAAVGHATGSIEATAAGAAGGKVAADKIFQALYKAPIEKITNLLSDALRNPPMAAALMTKASSGPVAIPLAVRSRLFTLLGVPVISENVGRRSMVNLIPSQDKSVNKAANNPNDGDGQPNLETNAQDLLSSRGMINTIH